MVQGHFLHIFMIQKNFVSSFKHQILSFYLECFNTQIEPVRGIILWSANECLKIINFSGVARLYICWSLSKEMNRITLHQKVDKF